MRPLYSLLLAGLLVAPVQAAPADHHPSGLLDVYRLAVTNNAELAAAHAAYQARSENVPRPAPGCYRNWDWGPATTVAAPQ